MGQGSCDLAQAKLHLEKINLITAMLNADATGSIGSLATTVDIDMSGTLSYDLEKLEPRWRPWART